jgi:hypothetical protein
VFAKYDTSQKGVDAVPSKTEIQSAVQLWAKSRMNGLPAPLYVIMVDHGSIGEFKLGDEVAVIRHRHGWEDGGVVGVIVELSEFSCVVQDDEGEQYEIRKCRDIRL